MGVFACCVASGSSSYLFRLLSSQRQAGVKDFATTIHHAAPPMANYKAVALVTSASSALAPIGKDKSVSGRDLVGHDLARRSSHGCLGHPPP
jgi:hypothetical protein